VKSNIEPLSITGIVFGIVTTEVTPPDRAASLKVLKFSLYSKPGSPTKTLISTIPGIEILPLQSIISQSFGTLFLVTFFPIAFIFPLSSIKIPPTSSILFCGSIILVLINSFVFICYYRI